MNQRRPINSRIRGSLLQIAFALVLAIPCHARIGETLEQISARYGTGQKSDGSRVTGCDEYDFTKSPYTIQVVFSGGKSITEVFCLNTFNGAVMSDVQIKDLLTVFGNGATWTHNKRKDEYVCSEAKLIAFKQPGHPQFFFIQAPAAVKAAEMATKPSANGF